MIKGKFVEIFSILFRKLHRGLSQPIRYHNNEGRKITYFSLTLLPPFCFYAVRYNECSGTKDLSGGGGGGERESGTVGNYEKSRKGSERLFEYFLVPDLLHKLIA